jgi:peptidoglycan/xylan/chitin deacetylase (PgdA/CDA1 family)
LRVAERLARPKVAILCYHRIGTGGVPFYSELPTALFQAQMEYLVQHYRIVPLADVPALLASGDFSRPVVAITFDDGYVGTYTEAFPILHRLGIPATTYLTAHCIETGTLAWYDRIFLALQVFEGSKFSIEIEKTYHYELTSPASRVAAAAQINSRIRRLPDAERASICRDIEKRVALPEEPQRDRMLTWQQVREMQAGGHSFGCHTMTHPAVSRLDAGQYNYELLQSRELIEQRIGSPVSDFCFPFGYEADCGDIPDQLSQFGYRTSTTMISGINQPGADVFRLRRSANVQDSLSTFAWRLSALLLTGDPAPNARLALSASEIPQSAREVNA